MVKTKPAWLNDFVQLPVRNLLLHQSIPLHFHLSFVNNISVFEPSLYVQASANARQVDAMYLELQALEKNNSRTLTSLPMSKK